MKRSLIRSMSRNLGTRATNTNLSESLAASDVKKDLVVMGDGRQVSGAVLIRASKDKSGEIQYYAPVLVQNGVETDLKKVDHIKLAKPKRSGGSRH